MKLHLPNKAQLKEFLLRRLGESRRRLVWIGSGIAFAAFGIGAILFIRQQLFLPLSDRAADFSSKLQAAMTHQAELERDLERATQMYKQLQSEYQTTLTRSKSEIDSLRRNHEELEEEYGQLQADRDRLFAQMTRSDQEREEVWAQVKAQLKRNRSLLKEGRLLRAEIDTLRSRLGMAEEEKRKGEEEKELLAQAERSPVGQKDAQRLRKIQEEKRELEKSQEVLEKEIAALRRQIRHLPRHTADLARQHDLLLKENADMHYNLGVFYSKKAQYPQAVKEFEQALKMRPNDADANFNLGTLYAQRLQDRPKAIAYFQRFLELNPRSKEAARVRAFLDGWRIFETHDPVN